jgi:DNA-directed RNA polymerase specialized sigma24 family protein
MYVVLISEDKSLLVASRNMLPYASKKSAELDALVNYMQNKIDANQAIEIFNQMVAGGERIGKVRKPDVPFRHEEGLEIARRMARDAARLKLPKLTVRDQDIIRLRWNRGTSVQKLAIDFNVSETTIYKALHGGFH